jgi:hypothetical protein
MENKKVMRMMTNVAFGAIGGTLLVCFILTCICFYIGDYIRGGMIVGMFVALYFLLKPILKQIFNNSAFWELYKK